MTSFTESRSPAATSDRPLPERAPRRWSLLLVTTAALTLAACAAPGPAKRGGSSYPAAASSGTAPASGSSAEAAAAKGDPDRRFQEALALMKAGRIEEAQTAFLALSRDYPQFSGPLTDLGILYAQSRQRELAVESLGRAVALNPNNEVAHNWLGTLYREGGDFARAERAYRAAIAARPDYAQAHLNLAILYDVALHQPEKAMAEYRTYQRLSGDDSLIVEAWIRELQTRIDAGRPAEAGATEVAGAAP